MLTAELYARAKELMCACAESCAKCPIMEASSKTITLSDEPRDVLACEVFVIKYPAEAVKLVELWWEENKHRCPNITKVRRKPNENDG